MGGLTEEEEIAEKIGSEERKLLIAQRKLESIRLLDELLERVKATSKSQDEINHLGKVILEAAKKDAEKKGSKSSSKNLTTKEKEIREKLVMKLKKKAEGDISRQQIKVNRAKNDDFESVSDADLSEEVNASDDEMEEISEDDLNKDSSDSDKSSEIDSDEELRLTSTDDDSDGDNKKKKRKKEKKDKKRRTREGERPRDPQAERDP